MGRWWDRNEEIDLVAIGEDTILFGEVKWSRKPVGTDIYKALRTKAANVKMGERKQGGVFLPL
jgi:AAA+ ATPase superfamily predicted ATPase